jgi:hypothetical protein
MTFAEVSLLKSMEHNRSLKRLETLFKYVRGYAKKGHSVEETAEMRQRAFLQ